MYSHRGISDDMIGGALVRRMLPGKPEWPGGTMLSREQFLAIPVENRWVLVEQEHFEIIIRDPAAQRYIVPREDGLFDVVSGRVLNAEPLDQDAAQQLVGDERPIKLHQASPPQRVQMAPHAAETKETTTGEQPVRRGRPRTLSDEDREAKRREANADRRLRRRSRRAEADHHSGQG